MKWRRKNLSHISQSLPIFFFSKQDPPKLPVGTNTLHHVNPPRNNIANTKQKIHTRFHAAGQNLVIISVSDTR